MPFIKSKKDIWITPFILGVLSVIMAVDSEDPRSTVLWAVIAFVSALMVLYGALCHLKFKKEQNSSTEKSDDSDQDA